MDLSIAAILAQDGITSGAIYALLALALVLVFSVTRVIFIPQGEFVAYGALTLAAMQAGHAPQTSWLLLSMGALTFVYETVTVLRSAELRRTLGQRLAVLAGKYLVFPLAVHWLAQQYGAQPLPMLAQIALTLLIIIPLGPMLYRLAYQPLAEASTLVLLIVSVGVHFALVGLGLVMFGAEGSRTNAFSDARFDVGALSISGQSLWIVGVSALLIGALYFYFERTLQGKALRATAVNRLGARLVGIGTTQAGRLSFTLAAAMGARCGILIAPLTTVYYESGFVVGLLESYSSFWASAFKEVIVFTLIIPVLLWRSLTSKHVEEEE
jgi:branched-chain amino acid transport system permease protein